MPYPRVLVITSCTGEKRYKPEGQLTQEDFCNLKGLRKKEKSLEKFAYAAGEMYTGAQHLRLMEGISILRDALKDVTIDLKILSAGYGLIDEHRVIVPYEVTFNDMTKAEVVEWSNQLDIHRKIESTVQNYDLIFWLLGDRYLQAVKLPIQSRPDQRFIALCSHGAHDLFSNLKAKTYVLPLGNAEAKLYSYGLVGLKGFLFKQFAESVSRKPGLLDQVFKKPDLFQGLLRPLQQLEIIPTQEFVSPSIEKIATEKAPQSAKLSIPNVPPAKNLHLGMRYFIPEWDDHVDPNYDFINDRLTKGRDPYHDEVYAHELYQKPNYDGILVSKTVLDKSTKKKEQIENAGNIHQFLRYNGTIMGDCGAFSYITKEEPPYSTAEIIDYYDRYGFDLGVSVDHLIVGDFAKDEAIRQKRYELTLNNAQDFIEKHQLGDYRFQPIGAAQGWSPESYAEAVQELLKMGYKRIGIGGVARSQTKEILAILQAVSPHLHADTNLHLFGVARINAIAAFRHLGVTSFDSASALRKAWLDPKENYHTLSGNSYTAVRIPQISQKLGRAKKLLDEDVVKFQTLKRREKAALEAIRAYDNDQATLEQTLKALTALDKLLATPVSSDQEPHKLLKEVELHRERYRVLLENKPWQTCGCSICKKVGVEVIIFRGNDRNRRRGFHNTYVFYQQFQEILDHEGMAPNHQILEQKVNQPIPEQHSKNRKLSNRNHQSSSRELQKVQLSMML